MTWTVEWDDRARRELRRLDRQIQKQILRYFKERIATNKSPRRFGHRLRHELQGLWRYRIGDYRVVCRIEDDHLLVLVLVVGHRRSVHP